MYLSRRGTLSLRQSRCLKICPILMSEKKDLLHAETAVEQRERSNDTYKPETSQTKLFKSNYRKTTAFEKILAVIFKRDLYRSFKDVPDYLPETKTADLRWKFYIRIQLLLLLGTGFIFFNKMRNVKYRKIEEANERLENTVYNNNRTTKSR